MNNIELYIASNKVEFNEQVDILYNYQLDDINQPTAVKNSFTKTITIPGTNINNKVFGEIWKLDRVQGTGGLSGSEFNSTKKTDFQLFSNGNLVETGYCKLDDITINGNDVLYSITLYGGLGDFFYNLTEKSADGSRMKLSDLVFENDDDLRYTINMDTVDEAWKSLSNKTENKWQTINFACCYDGLPKDFDSSHILINTKETTITASNKDGVQYGFKDGFVLGNLEEGLTKDEVRDYRSYLQRPVLRMKKIIEAACDPQNNGGYKVNLDPDFFNEKNPYWNDTWLTLPMISNLELTNSSQVIEDSQLIAGRNTGDEQGYMETPLDLNLGTFPDNMQEVTIMARIATNVEYHYSNIINWDWFGTHKWYGSLFVQMVAYSGTQIVGASQSWNMTTLGEEKGRTGFGVNSDYTDYPAGHYTPSSFNTQINDVVGLFDRNGYQTNGRPFDFTFTINNINAPVDRLALRFFWGCNKKKKNRTNGYKNVLFMEQGDYNRTSVRVNASDIITTVVYKSFKSITGDSLGRTGTNIDKYSLLNTKNTPCDYLLSYAKMFGLYFVKNPLEKEISILTRNSYYYRNDIVDLTKYIDKGNTVSVNPTYVQNKWVTFNPTQDKSDFYDRYELSNGQIYGEKRVDTGYNFDGGEINLMDKNCIKAGIEGHRKSKYFSMYKGDKSVRPWMVGMTYNLYNNQDVLTMEPKVIGGTLFGINEKDGFKFYDLFPKVSFENDGKALDGNDVLLFFSGMIKLNDGRSNEVRYILSDDTVYQSRLNDGQPCWLFSASDTTVSNQPLCKTLTELPVFERYLTSENGNNIQQSLDYGAPREMFVQGYEYGEAKTIYDAFWADYIADLYNENTKVLTCYVNLFSLRDRDKTDINELFRKFYFYDNSIWRINKITDYNVTSPDTTVVDFIRVNDIDAYSSKTVTKPKVLNLELSKYYVSPSGETITGTVTAEPGDSWTLTYTQGLTVSITSGTGTRTFNITVPRKDDGEVHRYTITARSSTSQVQKTITQNSEGYITVTEKGNFVGKDIPADGGSVTLEVDSPYPWTANPNSTIPTFSALNGASSMDITVTFPKSNNISVLDVTVDFSEQFGNTAKWTKRQLALSELHYTKDGGSYTVSASGPGIIFSTPAWLNYKDNGNGTYTFTADKNTTESQRNGTITASGVSVKVTQDPGEANFDVAPTSAKFQSIGGTVSIFITNDGNHSWSVQSKPAWITITPSTGNTMGLVQLQAAENEADSTRTGTVTIIDNKTGKTYRISVEQQESQIDKYIEAPSEFKVPNEAGSYEYIISASADWEIVNTSGTIGRYRKEGNSRVIIEATDNNQSGERTDTITVRLKKYPTYTASTKIIQEAPIVRFITAPDRYTVPSKAGVYEYQISASDAWQLSKTSGVIGTYRKGDSSVLIEATDNPNETERNDEITVSLINYPEYSKTTKLTQEAKEDDREYITLEIPKSFHMKYTIDSVTGTVITGEPGIITVEIEGRLKDKQQTYTAKYENPRFGGEFEMTQGTDGDYSLDCKFDKGSYVTMRLTPRLTEYGEDYSCQFDYFIAGGQHYYYGCTSKDFISINTTPFGYRQYSEDAFAGCTINGFAFYRPNN